MTTQASPYRVRIRTGRLSSRAFRRSRQPGSPTKPGLLRWGGKQGGIALITTLLLLTLLSLLGLTMAVTANSDMMINSYYGSYRGSFYAADAGLNIARAQMLNTLASTANGQLTMTPCLGWGPSAATGCNEAGGPLNGATAAQNAATAVEAIASSSFASLNAGQAANSWPANYLIPASIGSNCSISVTFPTGPTITNPVPQLPSGSVFTQYQYMFNYTLCAVGRAQGTQHINVKESGIAYVTVTAGNPSGGVPTPGSFATFGGFINNYPECDAPMASGTMTGRFFTNGSWPFGSGNSYIFTGPVGQADTNVSFMFGANCQLKNASSDTYNHQTIAPTFNGGFQTGQQAVAQPTDSFSQEWSVMDGIGHGESPAQPGSVQLNAYLKDINGNSYPSAGTTTPGVYIPYCTGGAGCTTPNTITGGGFYIEDNGSTATNIQLSLGTDASNNPTQTYKITQGGTITTITLDIAANSTTVVSGAKNLTLTGVPKNLNLNNVSTEGAVIYVDGVVSSLQGPGHNQASIQDYYGTTVAASGSINLTGDLIYAHEPVTIPGDALISGNDFNQTLGLFTANGDIVFNCSSGTQCSGYSNNKMEIDATLAALNSSCNSSSPSSQCGIATTGVSSDTITIVGGRMESNAHSVSLQALSTYFDQRYTSRTDGFAPPAFPSATLPATGPPVPTAPQTPTYTMQRTSWVTWPQ